MDVKISPPLSLIEKARALQYANRSRIGNKEIQEKVKKRAVVQASQKKKAERGLEVVGLGGQLEFEKKENYKIWTIRKRQSSGWLLIPSEDFVQNRLKGFPYSEEDVVIGTPGLKYIGNAIKYEGEPQGFAKVDRGRLSVAVNSVTIDSASDFTLEFLVRLPAVEGSPQIYYTDDTGIARDIYSGYFSSFEFYSSFYQNDVEGGLGFEVRTTKGDGWIATMTRFLRTLSIGGPISPSPVGLVENITPGRQYHVAYTVSGNKLTAFFDGKFISSMTFREGFREQQYDIWDGGLSANIEFIGTETILNEPVSNGVLWSTTFNSAEAGCGFSGLRLTVGDILYSGESFLPPESITSLV